MKYYELKTETSPDSDGHYKAMLEVPSWIFPDQSGPYPLRDGVPIKKWDRRTFAFVQDYRGSIKDFPPPGFLFHIMSRKLQEAITSVAPDAIQFLPIRIRTSIGDEVAQGYAIVNYLHRCDAVDRKRSVPRGPMKNVEKVEGAYLLKTLVLDPKKIKSPVFRMVGLDHVEIYREDVVDRIIASGATGVVFEPVKS